MNAALGAVGVVEIALIDRQPAQIVPRHGALLAQLAHQEVGERRLGLSLLNLRLLLLRVRLGLLHMRLRSLCVGLGLLRVWPRLLWVRLGLLRVRELVHLLVHRRVLLRRRRLHVAERARTAGVDSTSSNRLTASNSALRSSSLPSCSVRSCSASFSNCASAALICSSSRLARS